MTASLLRILVIDGGDYKSRVWLGSVMSVGTREIPCPLVKARLLITNVQNKCDFDLRGR